MVSSHQGRLARCEAAILAGGESRRMGREKAWLELGGQPLIGVQLNLLKQIFEQVRIVATDLHDRWNTLGIPLQPDLRPGNGPLGGIHAALATARTERVFVTACDFPFLNARLIKGLAKRAEHHDAVVPWNEHGPVPVCAFYSPNCLRAIEYSLNQGKRKATEFYRYVDILMVRDKELAELDPEGLGLSNLNTPEDYERARRLVAKRPDLVGT
jgi:molybdopterin-guanine dinucleotide biosynthesis protein A